MDKRAEEWIREAKMEEESVSQKKNLLHPTYWLTILICLMFYGAMTFSSYCNVLLHEDYGYTEANAGRLTSLLYIFGVFLSPPFGWAVDIYGKRMFLLAIGMFVLVPTFLLFALSNFNPIPLIVVMGFSWALVPAVFWTLIPLIVDEKYIGKAYGISYALYDGIIFVCTILYGHLYTITGTHRAGLLVFTGFTLVGCMAIVLLWILDRLCNLVFRISIFHHECNRSWTTS